MLLDRIKKRYFFFLVGGLVGILLNLHIVNALNSLLDIFKSNSVIYSLTMVLLFIVFVIGLLFHPVSLTIGAIFHLGSERSNIRSYFFITGLLNGWLMTAYAILIIFYSVRNGKNIDEKMDNAINLVKNYFTEEV